MHFYAVQAVRRRRGADRCVVYIEANPMFMQENVPLAPLTTLEVGGPARYFAEARTVDQVRAAMEFAYSRELPVFVLGGGSNVVVSDAGWPGLVLQVAIGGIEESKHDGIVQFELGAGEEWDKFVARAVARNCAGVECLSGIPGSVGGAPVQNIGAYGQEVAETIESVVALDLKDGQVRELCRDACGFSYRSSIFNSSQQGRYLILGVKFDLISGGAARIEYADLKKQFGGWSKTPGLAEVREAVRRIRASKGMLIAPGGEDSRSAGSFFKNPIVSADHHQELERRAAAKGLQIPSYPALEARRKVSAAWLVEHSGFARGYGSGNVGISRKHSLAIVNRGGATAAEIVALKDAIQDRVEEIWGIALQPEPVFVGF